MHIDLHVHIADLDSLETGAGSSFLWSGGMVARMLRRAFTALDGDFSNGMTNEIWLSRLADWVRESRLDKVVLLALDGVYDPSGRQRPDKTRLQVSNRFVHSASGRSPCFLFGASIHPYRSDALAALAEVVEQGACLIKWIPSGQWIQPDDPRCFPFFEAMAHYNIPLLTHTGVEHVLGSRRSRYNHPERLIPALQRGVTVIASHCGTRLFLHERSYFSSWRRLAREYENFFGDLGAFAVVTRVPCLKKILAREELRSKVLYGSDFPSISPPLWCWQLGLEQIRGLSRIINPLERNRRVMETLEVPEEIFTRAERIVKVHRENSEWET